MTKLKICLDVLENQHFKICFWLNNRLYKYKKRNFINKLFVLAKHLTYLTPYMAYSLRFEYNLPAVIITVFKTTEEKSHKLH